MSRQNEKNVDKAEANKTYWEAKRDGERVAYGPKETVPSAEERKLLRAGGLKIYVEGKIYREGK